MNIKVHAWIKPASDMHHGAFGFLGNHLHYTNIDKFFWIGLAIVLSLLVMVFKTKIYEWYHKKDRKWLFFWVGLCLVIFNLLSRIMLSTSGYPRHWEIIPLQLCRITFSALGIFLLLNRTDLVKWIIFPMVLGGAAAILSGSLDSASQNNWITHNPPYPPYSQGIDNYFYWDYYVTHMSLVVIGLLLWTMHKWTFTAKEMVIILLGMSVIVILVFGLDGIVNYVHPKEEVDYFYLGKFTAVKLWSFLGVFSKWPGSLLTYIVAAWVSSFLCWFFWILQGFWNIGKWEFYSKTTNPIVKGIWKLTKPQN